MKKMLIIALCLSVVTGVSANTPVDTLQQDVQLNELVVKAAPIINKADRKLMIPSAQQIKSSSNGIDLVSKLNLPGVLVNPVDQTIKLISDGKISLRVNGRSVDVKELASINPENVMRVEFHDNPSLRFGDAEVVIDYIIKNPTSGGRAGLRLMPSVNKGWQRHNGYLKLNNKKSEFSFNTNAGAQWDLGQWRDNTEFYTRKDGSKFLRIETGEPADAEMYELWNSFSYSYNDTDKQMFYASLNLGYENLSHEDYIGVLENQDTQTKFKMHDLNAAKSVYPGLDLYYQRNLGEGQLLMLNVVGNYKKTNTERFYTESPILDGVISDALSSDIATRIDSRSYSLVGEAVYEKIGKNHRFTAGVNHSQSWSKSDYLEYDLISRLRKSNTYMFAELWQRLSNKLDMTVGLGASYYHNNAVGERKTSNWVYRPKLSLRYKVNDRNTLRLSFNSYGNTPSISQLTSVEQNIDNNQVSVGNSGLKTYTTYNTVLRYEYMKGMLYYSLSGDYRYAHNPIMEYKYWGNDNIVSSYANHKNAHILRTEMTMRLNNIKNWVSLSLNTGFRRYIMHGNDYSHTYNNWYFNGQMEISHWNWNLVLGLQTSRNSFWGESLSGGERMHMIGLTHRYKNFNFGVIALSPFTNDYKRDSENRNQYAGYKRTTHYNAAERMVTLTVSWDIKWGRKHNGGQKRLNNASGTESVRAAGKG